MKTYIPYYLRLHKILADAVVDISDMFKEQGIEECHLKHPITLDFRPRCAGDEPRCACKIGTIKVSGELIALVSAESKYDIYYFYDLSDLADITLIYDIVYQHFYDNDKD